MRSTFACVAMLILAGAAVFAWQRSQNAQLRAQIAQQGEALAASQHRMEDLSLMLIAQNRAGDSRTPLRAQAGTSRLRNDSAAERADERRVIMQQYADVLAQMNLPAATASRLEDLLTDRIEAVLDAQDSAMQEGFAEGSAETARAVTLAIDDVDRDIAGLVGTQGIRRLDGFPVTAAPEAAEVPQPAAPAVNVTVVVQAPAAPAYADGDEAPAAAASPAFDSPYLYIPFESVVTYPRPFRPFAVLRTAAVRPRRPSEHFSDRLVSRP